MASDLSHLAPETVQELASLTLQLAGNEKTRKQFLKQVKEIAPGTPIPELKQDEEFEARLKAATEPLQKKFQDLEQERLKERMASQRSEWQQKSGLSGEDMEKVDKMITEGQLPADYKFAAPLYKAQATPADPTNYGSSGYGPALMPQAEGLMEDEGRWSLTTAHSLVDELRKKAAGSAF